jgi:hypothetical protein
MKNLIDAHKFFMRKSQHYILGNWSEYEEWVTDDLKWNKQLWRYYTGFVPTYIKFMWLTIRKK